MSTKRNPSLVEFTPEEREQLEQALSPRQVPSAYKDDPEEFFRIAGMTWPEYQAKLLSQRAKAQED